MKLIDARWRRRRADAAGPAPASPTPEPSQEVGHIYASSAPEPGQSTTALGRHRIPAHRQPDLSLEQATRAIPALDRALALLDLEPAEALIYEQLAGQWRGLPGIDRKEGDRG